MRAFALSLAVCSVGCLAPVAVDPVVEASTGVQEPVDEPDAPEGSTSTGGEAESTGAEGSTGSSIDDDGTTGQPEPGETTGSAEESSSSGGEVLEGCAAHPDALLCDDFESSIDAETWSIRTGEGGSVEVVDGRLRVELGSADGGHGFLRTTAPFPVPDNRFFGRVMAHISPESPSNHSYLFAAAGTLDGSTARYRLDSNSGGLLNSRYTHASVPQHGGWRKNGPMAEHETWTCIEWEFDGSTNSLRFWFDGVWNEEMSVDGAVEDPPWIAPEFSYFEVGYHTYQAPTNGDSFVFLYDDLVLATDRVGCPAPYKE